VPAYALCVGTKTAYDDLKAQITTELKEIHSTPPVIAEFPYSLKDLVPEVVSFSFGTDIPIENSVVVKSLSFSQSRVVISYHNQSEMRIKPNIGGYIFNKDGVIIASFQDEWIVSSLSPDGREQVSRRLSFGIPDELVFSRWAHATYDLEPAWFFFAGSSRQYDDLKQRT